MVDVLSIFSRAVPIAATVLATEEVAAMP